MAFGGYKQSGIGRETYKRMLNRYQQPKNMLVSYDPKAMGFFEDRPSGPGAAGCPAASGLGVGRCLFVSLG